MIETDYIKRKIEYLKYTTTTYTAALIVILWKIYTEPYFFNNLGLGENEFLIGIAFVFMCLAIISSIQWHQQIEKLNN
ncbi:MAG: hypothetical protein O8C66_02170 [Candidatus Methanoperedens sp.]|nr:hypothetical protein [Candidatus Methanoperedens sp.]MCZ7369292.1 hypothetical protein [Candidatus Methanoperedens sp.]